MSELNVNTEQAVSYILALCGIHSPSGYVKKAVEYLENELVSFGLKPVRSLKSSVLCDLGGEGGF